MLVDGGAYFAMRAHCFRMQVAAPARVFVRCPTHGVFCLAELQEQGVKTIADLKRVIYERLMLRPTQEITLKSWGKDLHDEDRLDKCAIQVLHAFCSL